MTARRWQLVVRSFGQRRRVEHLNCSPICRRSRLAAIIESSLFISRLVYAACKVL